MTNLLIKPRVFITGTMAYGPITDDSDIDIVLIGDIDAEEPEFDDTKNFREFLESLNIDIHDNKVDNRNYRGYTFTIPGMKTKRKIQIIFAYGEDDFLAWQYATKQMKKINPILDKGERVKAFQKFKSKYEEVLKHDYH